MMSIAMNLLQDILFPHAKESVREFLERNWETIQCKEDVRALKSQVINKPFM